MKTKVFNFVRGLRNGTPPRFQSYLKSLALILTLLLSVNLWGEDEIYKTALFERSTFSENSQSYDGDFNSTYEGFTVEIYNANNNNCQWDYIKIGGKTAAYTGQIYTASTIDEPITKVALTIDGINASFVEDISLYTSTDPNFDTYNYEGSFELAVGTQIVEIETPTENLYYNIEINCEQGSSNGIVVISKVEFYKAASITYTDLFAGRKVGSFSHPTFCELVIRKKRAKGQVKKPDSKSSSYTHPILILYSPFSHRIWKTFLQKNAKKPKFTIFTIYNSIRQRSRLFC